MRKGAVVYDANTNMAWAAGDLPSRTPTPGPEAFHKVGPSLQMVQEAVSSFRVWPTALERRHAPSIQLLLQGGEVRSPVWIGDESRCLRR